MFLIEETLTKITAVTSLTVNQGCFFVPKFDIFLIEYIWDNPTLCCIIVTIITSHIFMVAKQ